MMTRSQNLVQCTEGSSRVYVNLHVKARITLKAFPSTKIKLKKTRTCDPQGLQKPNRSQKALSEEAPLPRIHVPHLVNES